MKILIIGLLAAVSFSGHAQEINSAIIRNADQVQAIVHENVLKTLPGQKMRINKLLDSAAKELNKIVNDYKLRCMDINQVTNGINRVGDHLVGIVDRDIVSEKYFGNSNTSYGACMNEFKGQLLMKANVEESKKLTCGCRWFAAETHFEPKDRGFHLSYIVEVMNGDEVVTLARSSQYIGNNGPASQAKCEAELAANNFTCF